MSELPETGVAYQCPDCQAIYTQHDLVPLYECSRCGGSTPERRCEECNIFTARAGEGCEECAAECEEVEVVEDHDGALIPTEEWDPEESKAARDAAYAAERAREREEGKARERERRDAAATQVRADQVQVGAWIMHPSPDEGQDDCRVAVQVVYDWGHHRGVVVSEFGMAQVLRVPRETMFTGVPAPDRWSTADEARGGFDAPSFDPDGGAMIASSAPRAGTEDFEITLAKTPRNLSPCGPLPCLSISRIAGSLGTVLGVFVDRGHAERSLAVWEAAARALADAQGVEPVPDRIGATLIREGLSMHADRLGTPVSIALGTNDMGLDPDQRLLNVHVGGSCASLADPGRLLAAVQIARAELGHLNG